jgi:hypothetical protein
VGAEGSQEEEEEESVAMASRDMMLTAFTIRWWWYEMAFSLACVWFWGEPVEREIELARARE